MCNCRKILNRSAAFITAVLFMVLSVPDMALLASGQNPINSAVIGIDTVEGNIYDLTFIWDAASRSGAPGTDSPIGTEQEGYDFTYGEGTFPPTIPMSNEDPSLDLSTETGSVNLDYQWVNMESGTFYTFRVAPFHHHQPPSVPPAPPPPAQKISGEAYDMALLTNIRVNGSGSSNTLTVMWDNPTINGRPAFDTWNISYESSLTSGKNTLPPVSTEDLTVVGGRLMYEITRDDIGPGAAYTIYVEPVINGMELRELVNRDGIAMAENITLAGVSFDRVFFYPKPDTPGEEIDGAYKASGVFVDVELGITEGSYSDMLELWWPGFGNMQPDKITIIKSEDRAVLQALYDKVKNPAPPNYWQIPGNIDRELSGHDIVGTVSGDRDTVRSALTAIPDGPTYYMLFIEYSDGTTAGVVTSNIAEYRPSGNNFTPYEPVIREFTDNGEEPFTLSVTWDAFLRNLFEGETYDGGLELPDGKTIDSLVQYDIYISDEYAALDLMTPEMGVRGDSILAISLDEPEALTVDGVTYYTYTIDGIDSYWSREGGGDLEEMTVTDNKVYYVRIVARQIDSAGELTGPEEAKATAEASHYIEAQDLSSRPNMLSKPPLRIIDEETTTTGITLEWDVRYYEAYNTAERGDEAWYSRIGFDGTKYTFGENALESHHPLDLIPGSNNAFESPDGDVYAAIRSHFSQFYPDVDFMSLEAGLPVRFVDFTGGENTQPVNFALYYIPYDDIEWDGYGNDIDSLIDAVLRGEGGVPDESLFSVMPVPEEMTGSAWRYRAEELDPDTAYLFVLWPYLNNPRLWAQAPANIIGNTLPERGPIDIVPTVPVLEPVEEREMSLVVQWAYNPELSYELRYSDVMSDYPDGGELITNETIMELGEIVARANEDGVVQEYLVFEVTGLFPDTTYYLWIHSYVTNSEGARVDSAQWSNQIAMRTRPLTPPDPPRGLGLIGDNNLDIINKREDLEEPYAKTTYNYVIMEWLRILEDDGTGGGEDDPAQAADGDTEVDGNEIINIPSNLTSYIVKFNELEPNTPYYARVKTILTLRKEGMGGVRDYRYVIQLSKFEDFSEYVEVTVPDAEGDAAAEETGPNVLREESVWSETVRVYTDTWSGEYDAEVDPDTYPLPDEDFELTYDPSTGTLKYRFRSNLTDADGNRDNGVDNRLINRLIATRTYNHTIDLSRYESAAIRRRVVEIPYSVYSAMADRYISLTVDCGGVTYDFPAQFLNMPEVYAMTGFGYGAVITLTSEENPPGLPGIDISAETFASLPNRLSIKVDAGNNSLNVQRTVLPITVIQSITDRNLANDNISALMYAQSVGRWDAVPHTADNSANTVTQEAYDIGSYAVVSRAEPVSLTNDSAAANDMANINRKIAFSDLEYYDPAGPVTANQFNNLVAAIARSARTVSVNTPLSSDDYGSLAKTSMLAAESDALTREEAIDILVKLYELKLMTRITSYTPLAQSSHLDIMAAAPEYQEGLLKAADMGFFEETQNAARPKEPITFGELMRIVNIIVDYSGM